ncbi:MAG: cytochrome c [Pseudomonadota bacterium]|nr:cytochrome c [Pseudomonadota bacterium]MEC7495558.1 cytochrome c [Pseudomonadota bacterium]MEC7615325.1 cytochrome c [Pseudomonadota bacterium]MEC7852421.1 cytochrome c [Pseudomonadota bacterium]MEC7982951.1 cytochrome c [Pseudomonadota bacterium]
MRSLAPLAAAILIGTTAFVANAGVVEDRKANFKANNASMRAIGAAIGAGDFGTVTREAERIAAWAMVMPDYFPEGSGEGTSAKPAIWTDFVGFKDAAEANYYAAQELIAAAAKQDADAAGEALRAIGGTCKGCHQKFKSW